MDSHPHSSKSKHNLAMWSEVSGGDLDCGNASAQDSSPYHESGQRSPFRDRDDDSDDDDDVKPTSSEDNVAGTDDSGKIVGRGLHLSFSSDDDDVNFIPRSRRSDSPVYTKHRPAMESRLSLPVEVQSIAREEGRGGGKRKYPQAGFKCIFEAYQRGCKNVEEILKKRIEEQRVKAEEAHDGDLGGPSSRNSPTPPGSGLKLGYSKSEGRYLYLSSSSSDEDIKLVNMYDSSLPCPKRLFSKLSFFQRQRPGNRGTRLSLPEIKCVVSKAGDDNDDNDTQGGDLGQHNMRVVGDPSTPTEQDPISVD
jgi:hypothetical protein